MSCISWMGGSWGEAQYAFRRRLRLQTRSLTGTLSFGKEQVVIFVLLWPLPKGIGFFYLSARYLAVGLGFFKVLFALPGCH